MKLKFTAFLCSLFFFYAEIYAQCELTATVLPADIVCGDCTQLTAFGQGQGLSVFTEDFNSGAPTGWQSTSQATITSTLCNPHPSGTQYLWMGDAASVPRILTTTAYDFTAAVAGATICFDMVFAEQGNATPCEGPDEPDEGVAIQYSIDGGTIWTDINYFDPNGGNDPSLINWNTWCFAVPAGGLTNNTQFRWFQDNDSGAEYDHWGLDNVDIYFNDATYEIVWQHDGYSYGVGNSGGTNPTPVCPQTTTTYTVTMSNGTTTCTDQVTVNVSPPTFRVTADTAQTICAGECVDLVGEATVIKSPAAVRQFENNDFAVVATGSASVNVNVQGMNAQTITPGLITEICVNSFDFSGSQLCTDFLNGCNCNGTPISFGDMCNLDVSSFTLTVTTPDNCTITLVPAGIATQSYNSVCFVPSGGANINSGSFPTSGTWNPNEPFSVLDGCSTEGVWTLEFDGGSGIGFGLGTLSGWSITFDDPEISYTGNYTWSPTTNMTNSTSLNLTVCPTATSTYTLNVADTAGCTSASDDVTITIDNNCCNFNIGAVVTQPTCGASNGAIDISITNGSGNYTYNWTSGQGSNQDLNNIAAGTYNLTVTDVTQACSKDTIIVLTSTTGAIVTDVTTTPASCGNNDGTITITASGGTAPLQYSIDGSTYQVSNVFSNQSAGSYTVYVRDANLCVDDSTTTISNAGGATITDVTNTPATCGNNDGTITITASGGTAPLQYSIDGTTYQASNVFSNQNAGSYTVYVRDANLCVDDSTTTISNAGGAIITDVTNTPASCGNNDGTITITASGGTAPLQYSIDGTTYQASNVFSNQGAGSYTVYVRDANLCVDDSTTTISNAGGAIITDVTNTPATCGNNDGTITITASGGTAPLQYSIDGSTYQASNVFSNQNAGSYTVYVRDANLCVDDSTTTISNAGGATITDVTNTPATCGNNDGTITITASGGTAPLQYSIDGTTYQASNVFSNQGAGSYTVYVRDANLCVDDSTTTISNAGGATITDVTNTPTSCGNNDGTITITASGGTAPLQYSIDGTTYQANNVFSNQNAGSYTVYVRDANLCVDDSTTTISNAGGATISNVATVNTSCGNTNGTITITASGGVAPLTYSIDGGTTTQSSGSFTGLTAGTYNIVVNDANNCPATATANISSSSSPTISNVATTDATCGNADGSITITASGGTAPLSYSIDGGSTFQTSNIFNAEPSGSYNIVVEDASGCSDNSTAQINNIGGPAISNVATVNTSCGNANGTITITASGGTAPLQYSIDGGNNYQASNLFNNLTAGSYNISVQDANNCSTNTTAQIANSTNPSITDITATDENCNSADGSITVTAIDGTTPLSYSIDGGANFQSSNVFDNLSQGSYNIVVQDNAGCSTNGTAQINNQSGVDSLLANVSDVLCFGEESGSVQLSAYNGATPYTYFLVNNNTLQNSTGLFSNLPAGDYATWVQDANGCEHTLVVQIAEPTELMLSDSVINPSCFGNDNGQVILTATGGTVNSTSTPYIYTLGSSTNSNGIFLNIAEGNYVASVTDVNGCETSIQVQLNDPDPVFVEINPGDTSITLGQTFIMSANMTSASGTVYQYEWSPAEGLSCTDCAEPFANTYQSTEYALVFTDENGCQAYADIYVEVLNPNQYFIPNAFTPSGFDNTNNTFKVYGNHIKYIDMMVFNRWGEKIFESSSIDPEWDGTYKGKDQNPGVYNYYIKITFLNDDEVSEKGSITLLR